MNQTNTEQNLVNAAYGIVVGATIMTFVPIMAIAILAMAFFVLVLIVLYILRLAGRKDGLLKNHTTYLIRTIWITMLFMNVTGTFATMYLLPRYNSGPLGPCNEDVTRALYSGNGDISSLATLMNPCMDAFMSQNLGVFLVAALIGGGPLLVYLIYRIVKGGALGMKGQLIEKPKAWF